VIRVADLLPFLGTSMLDYLDVVPSFMTLNSIVVSLFLMALLQAAITWAFGFPTVEEWEQH